MNELRDRLELPPQSMADETRNLPVPAPEAKETLPMENRGGPTGLLAEDAPTVPLIVFATALLSALAAGAANPAGGLAVLPLGLLATVSIDFIHWRQHELRNAPA